MAFTLSAGSALTGGLTTIIIPDLGNRTISSFPLDLESEYYIFDILESTDNTAAIVSSPNVTGSIQRLLNDNYINVQYNGLNVEQDTFLILLSELSLHEASGDMDMGGFEITNVATPTTPNSVATKSYVDNIAAGLDPKESVRVGTTVDVLTLGTGGAYSAGQFTQTSGPTTIDGITIANTNRILVKNQADAKQNGIYVRTSSTLQDRAEDQNGSPANEVSSGNYTFIEVGTQAGEGQVLLGNGILTLDTDDLNQTKFSSISSYTAGNGIDISGVTISVRLDTDSGLEFDSGKIQIKTDITTSNTIGVQHTTNGAGVLYNNSKGLTETSETLEVKLENNGGLAFDGTNGGVEIKPDNSTGATVVPIVTSTNGAGVTLDNSTIEHNSGTLRVKADGINDTHIDQGTGTNQVNAADVPIIDSGNNFTATNVEDALAELFTAASKISQSWSAALNGNANGDQYLTSDSVGTNTTEFVVPVDCVIYAMSGNSNSAHTFTAEVHNGSGTNLQSLVCTSGTGYQKFVTPVAVTAGTEIRLYFNRTGSNVTRPRIMVFFKES